MNVCLSVSNIINCFTEANVDVLVQVKFDSAGPGRKNYAVSFIDENWDIFVISE